jgi:hypothetical protein
MAVVYQTYADNILNGGTVSGATPVTGYSASTLVTNRPYARVRYSSGTVTVTVTATASARGDVLCLPMHNLSGAVLTLTNGAGLSEAITIPTARANGFPQTLVADLTALEPNASTRTSSVWNLVISGNASNVILGGAVGVYGPMRTVTRLQWGYTEHERHEVIEHLNVYGSRLVYDLHAGQRSVVLSAMANSTEREQLRDWFRANHGSARPSLLWLDSSDLTTGYFGFWQDDLSIVREHPNASMAGLTFTEASKGVALV